MTNISPQINMSEYAREQMIHNLNAKMGKKNSCEEKDQSSQISQKTTREVNFSYDEYIEYCKQHAVMPNSESGKTIVEKSPYSETIRPIHVGQALENYSKTDLERVSSVFESAV